MQTAAINYRVADFLKHYPPFQYMDEADLLDLAGSGRVKFHESDEFILWQGKPHPPFVFVIQQGTVSMWDESGPEERLQDIRGAGDMLGIDRYNGADLSTLSAKSSSDVVIYALPAAAFARMLEKYPQAERYVAAYGSVAAGYQPDEHRKGAHETLLYDAARRTKVPVCAPGDPIRQAARRMSQAGTQAAAVLDRNGRVVGVLTADAVLEALSRDTFDPTRPVEELMNPSPAFLPPEVTVSQCVLSIGAAAVAVITKGGLPNGQLHGLISPSDLAPAFGEQPSYMLHEIPLAPTTEVLRRLQQRARNFVLEQLTSPESVEWLAHYLHQADVGILKRLAQLTEAPTADYCWCLYGAAGRMESLPPGIQRSIVILRDNTSRAAVVDWYRRMQQALLECGYLPRESHFDEEYSVATVAGWKQRYEALVRAPLDNPIYHSRPLFDLRAVMGSTALWRGLEAAVHEDVRANPVFVRLLANDCLNNLPPLAFFRDAVIEESGERSETLDLKRSALRPLVDVGRVFGIAAGRALGGSTIERFRLARTLVPEQESIFREAAQTLHVVLYEQTRAGIREHGAGWKLNPARLSHHDRQVLKSGFRSIHRLLEFTAAGQWMEAA